MSKKKFDPKKFAGKNRIWRPVVGHVGISRQWNWNLEKSEYEPPKFGKAYVARKARNPATGKREARFFDTLDGARAWLREPAEQQIDRALVEAMASGRSMTVGELIEKWRQQRWPQLSEGTRILYQNRLTAFDPIFEVEVESITSATVDEFFSHLRSERNLRSYKASRTSFEKELELFKTLLNWYLKMHDNTDLKSPFKARHDEMAILRIQPPKSFKYMREREVKVFLEELRKQSEFYFAIAVTQMSQIMRVSEVCAMKYSNLDERNRAYRLAEHVIWPRKDGRPPYLVPGTKSSVNESVLPLRQETLDALRLVPKHETSDLIFHDNGQLLTYRQVQSAYDRAFKSAGLSFSGTHVLRHTGATLFLNETGDTLALTQMGNWSNTQMALHYGKILSERAEKAVREADRKSPLRLVNSIRTESEKLSV